MSDDAFACPACGREALRFWFAKRLDGGSFPVRSCPSCRSAFVMPRPTTAETAVLYQTAGGAPQTPADPRPREEVLGDPRLLSVIRDGQRIAARLRSLAPGRSALDVGSGNGFHAHALLGEGFQVEAVEPNAMRRGMFRRINGFDAVDAYFDAKYVAGREGRFDAVLLSQVLEHLAEPNDVARHLHRLLRPGGVAAVAVPNFRSWLSLAAGRRDMFISPPLHLNFFTACGLRSLMERNGFALADWETVSWFNSDRVARRLRFRPLGRAVAAGLKAFLKLADRLHKGNLLEAYFRRADDGDGPAQERSAAPAARES